MSIVTIDDVMADPELKEMASSDLLVALTAAYERAKLWRAEARERRDGYTLLVSRRGDIKVEIDRLGGFNSWVRDAGELALHVGPSHDPNTGATVVGLLGDQRDLTPGYSQPEATAGEPSDAEGAEDEPSWRPGLAPLHWPGWSPRLRDPDDGAPADLTVEIDRVVWAWRCDSCGAASADADDFEPVLGDVLHRRCECGGDATRTPAVYCGSCDTLILLRSTDPDAPPPPV